MPPARFTLLALDHCPLTSVSGPAELLALANSLVPSEKQVELRIVSETTAPLKGLGGTKLHTRDTLSDIEQTDVLILGAIGSPEHHPARFSDHTLDWIRQQYQSGATIVSICTGAFILAATGLLDGKTATTHWACEAAFRQRFPEVDLQSKEMITQDGKLLCSGGASAYQDMSLHLIQRHFGAKVAHQCAKAVLIDKNRHSQQQYAQFVPARQHHDSLVHQLQDWLAQHATDSLSVSSMAERVHLSERQFKRRFKQATGQAPLSYLQALRMEKAKYLLETQDLQIDEIGRRSGYEDTRFFRQLFKRFTALSPTEYRQRFGTLR